MLTNVQLQTRIEIIENKLNEVQIALNNLSTKRQLKNWAALLQARTISLQDELGELAEGRDVICPKTFLLETDGDLTYIGSAEPGSATSASVWRICRLDESSSITELKYAGGSVDFDKIWDNRTSYSYF